MLGKLDRKQEQLTQFTAKQEEPSIKLKQSAKDIQTLNVKNDKFIKSLKEKKDETKKLKNPHNYYKDKGSRYMKNLIVDKDEETELLQEPLKELELERHGLHALDITEPDMVTIFENERYDNGIREIYINFLGKNV